MRWNTEVHGFEKDCEVMELYKWLQRHATSLEEVTLYIRPSWKDYPFSALPFVKKQVIEIKEL